MIGGVAEQARRLRRAVLILLFRMLPETVPASPWGDAPNVDAREGGGDRGRTAAPSSSSSSSSSTSSSSAPSPCPSSSGGNGVDGFFFGVVPQVGLLPHAEFEFNLIRVRGETLQRTAAAREKLNMGNDLGKH